jgi:hypothetical protein
MTTIKLGIVGAGFVAHFHAKAIQSVRSMEIAGITALDKAEALSAFVKKNNLGAGTVYPSIAEMAPHVDAIAVYVPNFARLATVEQIVEAVKKGAHLKGVICEKPLGRKRKPAGWWTGKSVGEDRLLRKPDLHEARPGAAGAAGPAAADDGPAVVNPLVRGARRAA